MAYAQQIIRKSSPVSSRRSNTYVYTISEPAHLLTSYQAPTVFPILFATVVNRATKSFLSWRLERGEKLGFLALLANCTSVVNTVLAQCSLQIFSVAGCVIAVLWTLSPIASQASLRIMSLGGSNVTRSIPMANMSTYRQQLRRLGGRSQPSADYCIGNLYVVDVCSEKCQRRSSGQPG